MVVFPIDRLFGGIRTEKPSALWIDEEVGVKIFKEGSLLERNQSQIAGIKK